MLAVLLLAAALDASADPSCNRNPVLTHLAPIVLKRTSSAPNNSVPVAMITVTVDPSGRATGTEVAQSSGDAVADASAVEAMKASTYEPGKLDCQAATMKTTLALVVANPMPLERPARVVDATAPIWPVGVRTNVPLTVTMEVDLDVFGQVTNAVIVTSSRIRQLDDAALAAATDSIYTPKISGSVAVPGKYLFKVTFDPRA